jgi:hypothetical protein
MSRTVCDCVGQDECTSRCERMAVRRLRIAMRRDACCATEAELCS